MPRERRNHPFRSARPDLHKPLESYECSVSSSIDYSDIHGCPRIRKRRMATGTSQCPLSTRYHEFSRDEYWRGAGVTSANETSSIPRYLRAHKLRTFGFYRRPLEIPSAIKRRKVETSFSGGGRSKEILRRSKAIAFLFFSLPRPFSLQCSAPVFSSSSFFFYLRSGTTASGLQRGR